VPVLLLVQTLALILISPSASASANASASASTSKSAIAVLVLVHIFCPGGGCNRTLVLHNCYIPSKRPTPLYTYIYVYMFIYARGATTGDNYTHVTRRILVSTARDR
jgi:hypothetical protein